MTIFFCKLSNICILMDKQISFSNTFIQPAKLLFFATRRIKKSYLFYKRLNSVLRKIITHPCNISLFFHTNTINNKNKLCLLLQFEKDEKSEHIRVSAGEGCRGER